MSLTNNKDYISLNASLNILDDGKIQFGKDKEAVRSFFINYVNLNTVFFHDLEEKINFLINNKYYDSAVFEKYDWAVVKSLYKHAYSLKFRFKTYMGAYKFYTSYALKTNDGSRYLERYEDRVVMYALDTCGGDAVMARLLINEVISGRFQPATPTFSNSGRLKSGEKVSCFLVSVQDNMESISHAINASLQLSKRGGGVGICLSNLREEGSSIKGVDGASSGILPVMKILEDTFSYANQLGQRAGAGAVFVHAHHPDIIKILDSKKENADEKVRIKTLSFGIMIPDITIELARNNDDMYLFSPLDIKKVYGKNLTDFSVTQHYYEMLDNADIKKYKINARDFLKKIAEVQTESGYPYIIYEDNVNRDHNLAGWISQSNICVTGDTELMVSSDSEGENVATIGIADLMDAAKYADLSPDLWVKAYDTETGEEVWEKVLKIIDQGETNELYELEVDGKSIKVTPNHEVYTTNRGWVMAKNLIETDNLVITTY